MQNQSLDDYIRKLRESSSILDCEPVPVDEISDEQDFLFISYSHKDYQKVYADLFAMWKKGIKFWYDEGLRAGKHWDKEVESILLHPRCIGVIFFISENLFLSKSVNQEIELICGKDAPCGKDYFSVNLTKMGPGRIIRSVMRMDDTVLDEAGLDADRIAVLASAFSDKQTYLSFSMANHQEGLIKAIQNQFPTVVGRYTEWEETAVWEDNSRYGYLEPKGIGSAITLKRKDFKIGRDGRWADYWIRSPFVGRRHAMIIFNAGEYWICDLHSANGTFVNGMRVEPLKSALLSEGDLIRIGRESEFVFHIDNVQIEMLGTIHTGKTAWLHSK